MPSLIQILKSSDLETRERQIQRLKKDIEDMSVTLEINTDALQRLKSSQ